MAALAHRLFFLFSVTVNVFLLPMELGMMHMPLSVEENRGKPIFSQERP
jgi:hypothetical protein